MSNKPLVFNYQHYDTLKDKAKDMALEIEELRAKINSLEEENMCLNNIVNIQQSTIDIYAQIFKLQEEELERLRHDS